MKNKDRDSLGVANSSDKDMTLDIFLYLFIFKRNNLRGLL